jgi:hypothetical protein
MRLGADLDGASGINTTYIAGNTINFTNNDNNASATTIIFNKNRAGAIVNNNDSLGTIAFNGFDGANYITSASIRAFATGTIAPGQVPGFLEFNTNNGSGLFAGMFIDEDGNVEVPGTFAAATTVGHDVIFPGIVATVVANDVPLLIDSITGQLGTTPSSKRYKENITNIDDLSEELMQLRPVTFTYKNDTVGQLHYGLIAEEVANILPNAVNYNKYGDPENVRYHEFPIILLNELQKQQKIIADLLNRIKHLEDSNSIH